MTTNAENGAPPRILVLDDEEVQRMSIHVQLSGLGTFIDFGDPRDALAHLKNGRVDAIVADIRMPGLPVDGIWFLEQLRRFDRDVGVVLRTADEDISIAQAGIEARAIQRVIKSAPYATARLREAVTTAIRETRERRWMIEAAAGADRTRQELVSTLKRIDDEITVAEMCRGFVHGLINQITTVAGHAELLEERLKTTSDAMLASLAAKNRKAAGRLAEEVSNFLQSPYLEGLAPTSSPSSISANECVAALEQIFRQHPLFAGGRCTFAGRGIQPDLLLRPGHPTRLLAALRHLVEYCALKAPAGSAVTLTTSRCDVCAEAVKSARYELTMNARWASAWPGVVFTLQGEREAFDVESLRRELRNCSEDPRVGNLLLLSSLVMDERLVLGVARTRKGRVWFDLYLPLANG